MSDEPDFGLDAMYAAPAPPELPAPDTWHGRRLLTFGASDVPALLYALGLEEPDATTPRYVREAAGRLFAVKAGIRKPRKAGAAADRGNDAEPKVVQEWNAGARGSWPTIVHASSVPREWLPLIDRHQPRLSCTPDAWCRVAGELVNVQIKTDQNAKRVAPDREWVWQVQTECAVTGSGGTLLVYGPGWASWNVHDRRPLTAWVIERDDAMIARIRTAAAEGWARVEAMRQGREKGSDDDE